MPKLTKRLVDALEPSDSEAFVWDADVKGFGVRVKPTGAKSFTLKYRIGTKTRRFTISKVGSPFTVETARARAIELLRGLHDGVDPADAKAAERKAVTVSELVDAYLTEGAALKPNKKASSWATDRSVIANHIKPLLGRKLAKEVTSAEVARFQADIAAGKSAGKSKIKGRGRAATGGRRVAALTTVILAAAYEFGRQTGRVTVNPVRGVSLFKGERRERFLSDREVSAIAEALASLQDEGAVNAAMADAVRLLLLTGCRKNEVLMLQWPWVDFDRRCLRLPDSKTGAKLVQLASAPLEILRRRRADAINDGAADAGAPKYVFPAARGTGPSVGLPRAWQAIKVRATAVARQRVAEVGLTPGFAPDLNNVRLHDLRHSFASFAIDDGATLYVLGKVLGHKQTRTTEGYAHLNDDPVRRIAERTGARIAEAMMLRAERASVSSQTA